ncbi:MAG: DUF4391 domain-containing protein [Peptostreptococcaceae bacterium]
MTEFNLPKETYINKFIPKTLFYEKLNVSNNVKQDFVNLIDKITWMHKLSFDTIRINKTEEIEEIQIFEIILKEKTIPKSVLNAITSKIPYPILFKLKYNDEFIHVFNHEKLLTSEWNKKVVFDFSAINLKNLYEKIVLTIIEKDTLNNSFANTIEKRNLELELIKKISEVQNKIKKEKQFNRKLELNMFLNNLKKELEELDNE